MQEGTVDFREFKYTPEDLLFHFHEERNRARMHSFSEVSELVLHDLTNPLAVVKFCIDQLELNPNLLKEKPQYLEKIKNNLDRAFDIIDSFRTIVRKATHSESSRFDASHKAAVKLIQAQYKDADKSLTINFDPSLEGIMIRIPQFDAVFALDTIYRILLAQTPADSATVLSLRKESLSKGMLNITISTNSNSTTAVEGTSLLNLFNLRVINQQLSTFGGHVDTLDKSLTECAGTNLRIGLPLEVGK